MLVKEATDVGEPLTHLVIIVISTDVEPYITRLWPTHVAPLLKVASMALEHPLAAGHM